MQTKTTGNLYEQKAKKFLQRKLWRPIAENYSCKLGEIDLVMQNFKRSHIIFVEVRYRNSQRYGGSIESITYHKQQRLIKTAQHFLMRHPKYHNYLLRFDAICFDQHGKLDWIQDAFRVE